MQTMSAHRKCLHYWHTSLLSQLMRVYYAPHSSLWPSSTCFYHQLHLRLYVFPHSQYGVLLSTLHISMWGQIPNVPLSYPSLQKASAPMSRHDFHCVFLPYTLNSSRTLCGICFRIIWYINLTSLHEIHLCEIALLSTKCLFRIDHFWKRIYLCPA